jgi:hypothetical protein
MRFWKVFQFINIASIPKYTLSQLLNNDIAPPYSRADFLRFVTAEVSEENFEFLLAVAEYEKIARFIFPAISSFGELSDAQEGDTHLIEAVIMTQPHKPLTLNQGQFDELLQSVLKIALDIKDRFIVAGSVREINLSNSLRKELLEYLNSKSLNPLIFYNSKKHITEILQTNSLYKFLRKTYEDRLNTGMFRHLN